MRNPFFLLMASICLSGCASLVLFPTEVRESPSELSSRIAALPPGSQVEIVERQPDGLHSYLGTVLKTSPNGVALMNCQTCNRSDPKSPQYTITSRDPLMTTAERGTVKMPVQWVPIGNIRSAEIIARGHAMPDLEIDTGPVVERRGLEFDFNKNADKGVQHVSN